MNTTDGTFIVIEGTDGSGKGTQYRLLAEQLRSAGYEVETFDFPQYDQPSSYFVRQYLNGRYGQPDEVGPYTSSLFYALDRYEVAKNIRRALDAGKIVLANRFVGSNMAHQGTKFVNAEERRGYFIWLDNLEFEMLKIPRPTISFVLRVPASIAQQLVDQKSERSYTSQKRDVHEADLNHLERSVAIYDEMCQLFPRDFVQIDCVRNGRMLEIDAIQRLLWQKLNPILPSPPQLEMPLASVKLDNKLADIAEPSNPITSARGEVLPDVGPTGSENSTESSDTGISALTDQAFSKEVSSLFLAQLRYNSDLLLPDNVAIDRDTPYITPHILDSKTRSHYQAILDKILELHDQITDALVLYLSEQAPSSNQSTKRDGNNYIEQAQHIARAVLPVAITVPVAITETEVATVQKTFKQQLAAFRQLNRVETGEQFSETYTSGGKPVQLVTYTPRNELNILADLLYPAANSSLQTIQTAVDSWPYAQKVATIEKYFQEKHNTAPVLKRMSYCWEINASFTVFSDMAAAGMFKPATVEYQMLTPRYGYEVPDIIEEAGVSDQFEACFDMSLQLHSYLEQAGYRHEAQYSVLHGHRMRWTITHDGRSLFHFNDKKAASATYKPLVDAMVTHILEVQPLIGGLLIS